MKNVIIINSHANTTDRKNILIECINRIKKLNLDIILISNFQDDINIQNMVDHYIFSFDNTLLNKEKSPLYWFADSNETIHLFYPGVVYIVYKHMCMSISYANLHGYDKFFYLESDNLISDLDLEKINSIFNLLDFKKIWLCNFDRNLNKESYSTGIFAGNAKFFKENLFLIKDISEWNTVYPFFINNESLEFLFPLIVKNVKSEIYLEQKYLEEFFSTSQINVLNSYTSVNLAFNEENNDQPVLFVITNSGEYELYIDEKLVFNRIHEKGEWLKYKIKIGNDDTEIKLLFNKKIIYQNKVNMFNVEHLKLKSIRYKL